MDTRDTVGGLISECLVLFLSVLESEWCVKSHSTQSARLSEVYTNDCHGPTSEPCTADQTSTKYLSVV